MLQRNLHQFFGGKIFQKLLEITTIGENFYSFQNKYKQEIQRI